MFQSVIESIIVAATIITLVTADFYYSFNPLDDQITHQVRTVKNR
ncbi:MAG: hypothetical protein VYC17_03525 [Nitrospinota bacterium]|nr:hypothetical protein [Nitrospinota bacterium]